MKRALATAHLALISPALVFLAAVLLQWGAVPAARHIVAWYAARMWTLWILLLALPLSALISGSISLLREMKRRSQVVNPQKPAAELQRPAASRSVAATTGMAAIIVGIVVLHMLAN